MADLIVDGCAHTFRESLIVQRGRDSAVLCREAVDDLVDLGCAHPDADVFGHFVQHCGIQRGAFPDHLDLMRCLQQLAVRHDLPSLCVKQNFFLDRHVAFLVLFPTAAPAKLISLHE